MLAEHELRKFRHFGEGQKLMPFKSQAQRKWMYSQSPEMAKRWEADTPAGKLPKKAKKKKPATKRRKTK